VLHPMGWDAFGLPAENAAIQRGVHPARWTYDNIAHMRRQLQRPRLLRTTGSASSRPAIPRYYSWSSSSSSACSRATSPTSERSLVNWCPQCETVLANEQVETGVAGAASPVVERELEQWFLRITAYARSCCGTSTGSRAGPSASHDAAELDRPERRARDPLPAWTTVRARSPSSRHGPTRSSA
jgi:leucyl-tRNA synthetase